MKKIIVVSAVWCPSCLILKKNIKKLKDEYEKVEIQMLDYDFDEEEVEKYNDRDKLPVIICGYNSLIDKKTYEEIVLFLKENDYL